MYPGRYINLATAVDRRQRIERNLFELGINGLFHRYEAQPYGGDTPKGLTKAEFGCLLSHCEVLRAQTENIQIVLEDDVVLSEHFRDVVEALPASIYSENDFVFFGFGINAFDFSLISRLTDLIINHEKDLYFPGRNSSDCVLLDCKDWYRHGLHAYAVNISAKNKILEYVQEQLNAGVVLPIDLLLRKAFETRKLTGTIIFPPVVGTGVTRSTHMGEREALMQTEHHEKMSNLFVRKFDSFKTSGRNRAEIEAEQHFLIEQILSTLRGILSKNSESIV